MTTGDRYHVDISQKVPLNSDRDNVTPSYLREVRTAVLNKAPDRLDQEEATENWVTSSLPQATPEALEHVLTSALAASG